MTPVVGSPRTPATRRLAGAAITVAMALGACSFVPPIERPTPPVPERFPGDAAAQAGAGQTPAAEMPWRRFFNDPRLTRLIELGLAHNRDLRVAALNVERAAATWQIQRAETLPTLNATGQHLRQRLPAALSPTRTAVAGGYEQIGVGITSFELDFFGRVRALTQAALASYLATEEARRASHVALVGAIANGWLAWVADDDQLRLARETLASRQASLALIERRVRGGVAPATDLAQAQSLLEAARASVAQWSRARALDENALALLIGQRLPEGLGSDGGLAALAPFAPVPAGLPADLLIHRPDIRAAEQSLIGANANIGAARAAFFPRIALTTTFGQTSAQLDDLFSSPARGWSFVPSFSVPIFDGGRAQAGLDGAQAARAIAVAQYEKAIQVAFREVADALASRDTFTEQLRALQAQETAEAQRVRLAELRYRGGVGTPLEWLDAQRSLFTVQQARIGARQALLQSEVTLYRSLGGGWVDEAARPSGAPTATRP